MPGIILTFDSQHRLIRQQRVRQFPAPSELAVNELFIPGSHPGFYPGSYIIVHDSPASTNAALLETGFTLLSSMDLAFSFAAAARFVPRGPDRPVPLPGKPERLANPARWLRLRHPLHLRTKRRIIQTEAFLSRFVWIMLWVTFVLLLLDFLDHS